MILAFLNVKNLPFDFNEKDQVVLRYAAKFSMMVVFPLAIINMVYREKHHFGLRFFKFSESLKLTIRSYAVGGPAGMTFLLIGALGWTFNDWKGALTLSLVYGLVFYFVPKVTQILPSRSNGLGTDGGKGLKILVIGSLVTLVAAYFSYASVPILSKILYYLFIVGFGEELLFRGYIQSSFNRFFGKPFKLANVEFGWGMILSAALFGLIHSLTTVPPSWPWAVFTFVMGLSLGFVREKDGSILSAVLLHALLDMPLAFFS